jgi:acyl-CoA synthetase (AMP-forming)/AMP-acid ligase II
MGVRHGDRVGLVFDETEWIEYLVAYAATHKAGAVAVPMSRLLATTQVCWILGDSGASVVCSGADGESLIRSARSVRLCELERGDSIGLLRAQVDPSDLAEILYTSGTTGVPKGVACSHEQLLFGIVTDGAELERH